MCIDCLVCDYYDIKNNGINEHKKNYFDICKNCVRKPKINYIFPSNSFLL